MYEIIRRQTKKIKVGNISIGNKSPISIQSMCTTKTYDIDSTVNQINDLKAIGCDIIRVAVPDIASAEAIEKIKKRINIPLIADIHFDYRLALKALEQGIDGLRINPGNIGNVENVKIVAREAKRRNVPIRIGINSGSIEKDLLEKYGNFPTAEAMVQSAIRHIIILEQCDFYNIKVSLKANSVPLTIEAYRLLASQYNYPLHIGITEAGTIKSGIVKSAIGIGILLAQGIGDTIRVSLTDDPKKEVKAGIEILKVLGLKKYGVELISCPTCARTEIDLINLCKRIEKRMQCIIEPLSVAIMGCVVNGPGEAKQADIGIAGGKGEGVLFIKGEIIKKVPENKLEEALFIGINDILKNKIIY